MLWQIASYTPLISDTIVHCQILLIMVFPLDWDGKTCPFKQLKCEVFMTCIHQLPPPQTSPTPIPLFPRLLPSSFSSAFPLAPYSPLKQFSTHDQASATYLIPSYAQCNQWEEVSYTHKTSCGCMVVESSTIQLCWNRN